MGHNGDEIRSYTTPANLTSRPSLGCSVLVVASAANAAAYERAERIANRTLDRSIAAAEARGEEVLFETRGLRWEGAGDRWCVAWVELVATAADGRIN